ncbi:MAG: ABC transporter permease subunit [Anaerolineales bacterium]|nr:ABC transporter permease subunit [Anaerolineales bacterium]
MNKITTLIKKEWREVFKNRFVLFSVAFMPLIFTAIPLAILYGISSSGQAGDFSLEELYSQMSSLCGNLNVVECNQYLIITQFMPLFMMMPVIIPITIASYSIVGEKVTRTLEPLLATPITTMELLAGKGLAAGIPAVLATWVSFLIFVVGGLLMKIEPKVVTSLFNPLWLLGIFVLGPLLAIAAISLAVMVSSRSSDPRVAEQIAGLFILPLAGLLVAQATGLLFLDTALMTWITLGVAVLDAGLLAFSVQLFQRESILTRWK